MKKVFAIIICSIAMFSFMNIAKAETIRNLKKKLDVLLIEAQTKKETIKQTETEMFITRTTINKIYSDMEFISSEIIRIQDEMIILAEDIKSKDKQIKELIKAYQTTTEGSFYIEYIFGAETIEDFIYRYSLTEQISRYNNELIKQMDLKIEEDKKKNEEMKVKTTELEVQQGKLKVQLNSLGTKKEALQEQEQSLEDEIKSAQEVIGMYEKAGCDLDEDLNVCANRLLPPDTRFYRPTTLGYITSNFGNRINPLNGVYTSFHSGIDMSAITKTNTSIFSVANGVVAKIYYSNCGGNQVFIHHNINGKKYTSAYLHLSKVLVVEGQIVSKETTVGMMGGDNFKLDRCSTGAHLHLSIAYGLRYKDYWTYNDYVARLIDPRQVINFPVKDGPTWYDRITRF
jgi:murein DD-endopeptidase MepM/ murein hydrolase activator NlpD